MQEKQIDSKSAGLTSRDVIIQTGGNDYALFIDRKSRIVMADASRILKKVQILREHYPESRISLKTTAPVCSKTRHFLETHRIDIV